MPDKSSSTRDSIRILYISYDGMTDPLGQSQVLPYLFGLAAKGFGISLISFEKPQIFESRKESIASLCDSNSITWIPIGYTKHPPLLSTLWDIKKLSKIVSTEIAKGVDIIHCRSYIPSLVALKVKRMYGVPFIFDMRGLWADERVDGDLWNLNNPIFKKVYNFFKKKELEFLRESAHIVSLTENGKSELLSWGIAELTESKIAVIPCAADFDLFTPNSKPNKEAAKKRIGLTPDTYVLSYLGSLGTWYLLDEMLAYYKCLREHHSKSAFLLLTPNDPSEIRKAIVNMGIPEEEVIVKFVHREEIPIYMHSSDHSVFFIKESYSKKSSSPTKMGEILAMGIPIVANAKVGDIGPLMQSLKAGRAIKSFDDDSYHKAIDEIYKFESLPAHEIRDRARSYYSLEKGVQMYADVYKKILNS